MHDVQYIPIEKLPCTVSLGTVLLCKAKAMKLGWEVLTENRLYNKLRPVDWWVLFRSKSIDERRVNPKPAIPWAP